MIRSFKIFRYKLSTENQVARYLRYAIGEIMLVVIGILIAIGINNWRELQKENNLELAILSQITISLEKDSLNMHELIAETEKHSQLVHSLKDYMKRNMPYTDSLKNVFSSISYFSSFNNDQTSFEKLLDAGINIVKNDSIQNLIPVYFRYMKNLSEVYQRYPLSVYFRNEIYPKYFKSFSWGNEGSEPKDYEGLKTCDDFYIALDYVINDTRFYLYSYMRGAELNSRLLRLLKKELKERKT
ncbi:MAG: DUF6090 family protein [Saprospiraceae bacterium]